MPIPARALLLGAASAAALAFTAAPALTQFSGGAPSDTPSSQMQRVVPKLCVVSPDVVTTKRAPYTFFWGKCRTGGVISIGANATVSYVNDSGIRHRLKIGSFAMEPFSTGARSMTVHFASGTTVPYECTLHPKKMHGTVKVV